MRWLIVASGPERRCGIAKYAVQQADALRREGHHVEYASLDGSPERVEHVLDLRRRLIDYARLRILARGFDRVSLHWQHDLFLGSPLNPNEVAIKNGLLAALFASHPGIEVVAHEIQFAFLERRRLGRKVWISERLKWRSARRIVVHSDRERHLLSTLLPELEPRIETRIHHAQMQRHRDCTQGEARGELGIESDARVFLCIGFLQHSKGFDRAVQAFRSVRSKQARLYVVGSVRLEDPANVRHAELLRNLAAEDPRVRLVERFVDDREFDTWVIAADVLICPYREIWTSGVAARAKLHEKPLIVSRAGGLSDQSAQGDLVFEDEAQLEAALAHFVGEGEPLARSLRPIPAGLKLAFVLPWYADDLPGGAEAQARRTIHHLRSRGVSVDVLTTCLQGYFSDWNVNARPAGWENASGVPVLRFRVKPRNAAAFNAVNAKIVARQPITAAELKTFQDEMIKVPSLFQHLERSQRQYDLFVFVGYMFATAAHGSRLCPGKAVHIPCLHDEGYLDLAWYQSMLREARGLLFNSPAEQELAQRRIGLRRGQSVVAGEGVDTDWAGDAARFRRTRALQGDYLLFLGRKDVDKNFPLLLRYFRRYRDERAPSLKLVIAGPGRPELLGGDRGSILDLGFLKEADKRDALAGSLALVQPSVLESFSIVLMEGWLARRPALVHGDCAVTREHCLASSGGLSFRSFGEFAAAVDRLRAEPALAAAMGEAGRRYVLQNFSWPAVIDRYLAAFSGWRSSELNAA